MFDVKTAVRIALLENTGLAEVAIKSVVDAVVGMTTPVEMVPCCWIIERVGHPVSITHYQTVADSQRSFGAIVTAHVPRLV